MREPMAAVHCWRERGGKILKKKKQNFPDPPVAYTLDLDIESAFKEIKDERAETWIASSASYHLPKFFTETGENKNCQKNMGQRQRIFKFLNIFVLL